MNDYLQNLFSLKGKTCLVTGGGKGIGRMLSEALFSAGASVIISSRSAEDCEIAAKEISNLAGEGQCLAISKDLSSLDAIKELANEIEQRGLGLDVLVNNSGRTWGSPIGTYPEKGWDSVMNLNVKTPYYLVEAMLPLLEKSATPQSRSRIINIGSINGIDTETLSAYAYGASKAAIHHLSKGLASDLASRNINCNVLAPGFFKTKMVAHIEKDEEKMDEFLDKIPLRRIGGPDDIAGLIIYLASSASEYMTGSVIPLDGGYLVN